MPLTVADIMNPKLLYIREGDRLSLARKQILSFGVTAVPVLDDEHKPVGVVSLRDLFETEDSIRIGAPAYTVRSDMPIDEGARELARHPVHHLVVVDKDGIAVGMVSAVDFLRAMTDVPVTHPAAFERY